MLMLNILHSLELCQVTILRVVRFTIQVGDNINVYAPLFCIHLAVTLQYLNVVNQHSPRTILLCLMITVTAYGSLCHGDIHQIPPELLEQEPTPNHLTPPPKTVLTLPEETPQTVPNIFSIQYVHLKTNTTG